jgi:DNA repair protein RadC
VIDRSAECHQVSAGLEALSGLGCPDLLARIVAGSVRPVPPLVIPATNAGMSTLVGMPPAALMRVLHVDWVSTQRILLAFALHRRLLMDRLPELAACRTPDVIARIMLPLVLIDHERLWCLPLDPHCRLIGEPIEVARGDVDGTDAGPRACCRVALRTGAVSMVVVHNHPSGDPSPSAADRSVTRRLATAGRTIDVPLQDHVICTSGGDWISLRRQEPELFT